MKNVENGRKCVGYASRALSPALEAHNLLYRTVTDLGGKPLVMQLMTHPDPDVKFRALVAVQRLVVLI